jgi:hypothetical protein
MRITLLVGYLLVWSLSAMALVPVEGILMGEAVNEYQRDPLFKIFNDIYDKSHDGENKKLRLYRSTYSSGVLLGESCHMYAPPRYSTSWMEKQAKRSVVSTLQYIGMDTSIKAIGAYAKKLQVPEDDFERLSGNLVDNYCSKNLTIFSLKKVKQSLSHYYKNPQSDMIPSVESSPFVTALFKLNTDSEQARSIEFDQAIQNFKAFCSWGGDVTDYRLLSPYLKNSFIMAFVLKNMVGVQDQFDATTHEIIQAPGQDTVQVACKELICRKTSITAFKDSLPLSVGSTGLYTDLAKLYCHHFKGLDYSSSTTIPNVKTWIKNMELEEPIFETNFFISMMTGVPDPTFGVESYRDLPAIAKSTIDERWNKWASETLKIFSTDLLYEESLKIKVQPRREFATLRTEGFLLDFSVTLGEMDRVVDDSDKLKLSFDLNLSKNYLRHMRVKWSNLSDSIDETGKQLFRDELTKYIDIQLKGKEKLYLQRMWNEDFSRHIVQELLGQVMTYRGPLFESYKDQMLKIPVKFSYGVFALSYLRYRADVNSGRLGLN